MYFGNMPKVVPDFLEGVAILKGVESNILDYCGRLDLSEKKLAALDWVIASYHINCVEPSTPEEHTAGWLAVAKNPHVDVIRMSAKIGCQLPGDRALLQEVWRSGCLQLRCAFFHTDRACGRIDQAAA